jgi:hypothetical protein
MKPCDAGREYTEEFCKLAISSQIAMLDMMARTLGSFSKETQGSWVRDMYKTNANIFNLYFRTMEQAAAQSVEIQLSALKQFSDTLEAVRSNMERGDKPSDPKVKTS